jgi:DNA polymerase-1
LIERFGSLEGLLERAIEVPQKSIQGALLKYADQAHLSKQLATIDTQVPIDFDMGALRYGPPDSKRLREIFKELEFQRLLQEWTEPHVSIEGKYALIENRKDLQEMVKKIEAAGELAIQVLMSTSTPMRAQLLGVAMSLNPGEAYYIPLRATPDGSAQISRDDVLEILSPYLEDPQIGKVGHDLKTTMVVMHRHGARLGGIRTDTMVASYVINPSRRSHGLEGLALEYLDQKLTPLRERLGERDPQQGLGELPLSAAAHNACEKAEASLRLARVLIPKVRDEGFAELFYGLEIPLIPVLARMEMHGVMVDASQLAALSSELEEKIYALEEEIYQLVGGTFNINSPQQLGAILFERLKLPVIRKTKTGYSTDMDVLKELAKGHALPSSVLEYRSLAKLKSTYVDVLPRLVNPETGRIHTSFNQAVTATGRLSSSEPNLQNIPIRGEWGQKIRRAFIPEKDCWLFSADYNQVELRILAHLSEDPVLLEAFDRNEDIHLRTAAEIFGVPLEEVTPQMRREAKVINFGIIYGMSAYGLARELDVEPKVAKAYIDGYFQRYKGVRGYLDGVLAAAKKKGYVETLMHRRRYLPEIGSPNQAARKFAERTAINTPIQGTAADMIKKTMIRIQERMDAEGLASRMLLQVHDELVFEVPEGERDRVASLVREEMEGVERLTARLGIETGWGKNWAETH